jgi:hypothetical protein
MNITPNNNPNRILEHDEKTPSPPSSPELFSMQASYASARELLEEEPISITPRPYQNIEQELMGVRPSEQIPASPRAVYQFRPFQGIPSADPDVLREFLRFQDISIFENWPREYFDNYRDVRSDIPNRTIPYTIREEQEREQRNRQRQQSEEKKDEEEKEKPKKRSNIRFMR